MTSELSPMLVQYLVGLCCLRWTPEEVDVTLGDYVLDQAAEKERDVDVTVRVRAGETGDYAFIGYEVKREANPLDVVVVEQLSQKLKDMQSVSHRAIVSTSGYTESARKKAKAHGVILYELKPWTKPVKEQFPAFTEAEDNAEQMFRSEYNYLMWAQYSTTISLKESKAEFVVQATDPVLGKSGKRHKKFTTYGQYQHEVLLRSTEILLHLNPAQGVLRTFPMWAPIEDQITAGPAWPHTHTLDLSSDEVYIKIESGIHRIDSITISGQLQWRKDRKRGLYYIMEEVDTCVPFAGAIVLPDFRGGRMTAMVISPGSRQVNAHRVQLLEKQLNILKGINLSRPAS